MVMMMCIQVEVQELKEQLDMLELVMLLGPLSTKRRRIMVMMMCIQVEVQELKEQLNMLESATSLGALSINPHGSAFTDDSITDLGIRKTLNFSTPDSTTRLDQKWFIGHNILFACKGKAGQTDIQMSCTSPVLFVRVSTLYMSCFVCVGVHPVHVLFCLCRCPPCTCPVLPVSLSPIYTSCFVCVNVYPVHVLFCLCRCPPCTCPVLSVSVSTLYMSCFVCVSAPIYTSCFVCVSVHHL